MHQLILKIIFLKIKELLHNADVLKRPTLSQKFGITRLQNMTVFFCSSSALKSRAGIQIRGTRAPHLLQKDANVILQTHKTKAFDENLEEVNLPENEINSI